MTRRGLLAGAALVLAAAVLALAASVALWQTPVRVWEAVNRYLPLPTAELQVGGERITVEIATGSARGRGLMHRAYLPEDHGMLFVYRQPRRIVMWMKNTRIPLSVAFIDADGTILNIARMEPLSEQRHASRGPAMYALEMNRGWFEARGVQAGDRIDLSPLPVR